MVLPFVLTFLAGFLVKLCDRTRSLLFGIAYGLALGALCIVNPAAATVFVPSVIGNFAAGKIDTLPHFASLVPFGFLVVLSLPELSPLAFFFFAAAYLDEKLVFDLPHPRPLLPVAAALASLWTGNWEFLAFVLLFDAGYLVFERFEGEENPAKPKKKRKRSHSKNR